MHYRPQIDGLRAIAVLCVLFSHSWNRVPGLGHIGVRLFFVISGYLITGVLVRGGLFDAPGATLRSFFVRRCLRLMPAYYAALVLFCAICADVRGHAIWHALFATNLLIALNADWGPALTVHFWSLGVEEQFYLLWPFGLLLLRERGLPAAAAALFAIALAWRWMWWSAGHPIEAFLVLLPAQVDALGAGALLFASERHWRDRTGLASIALPLSFAAMALVALPWSETFRQVGLDTVMLAPMALAVAAAAVGANGWAGRLLAAAPVSGLGRISYGFYLFHTLAIEIAGWLLQFLPPALVVKGSVKFAISAVLATIFALVSWYLIERPFLRLRRRVRFPDPAGA